jgi:molybdate transport repressor ModE-like protein
MSTTLHTAAISRVKTRQMVLLAHIDQHGSLLHAAEAAGMSQPAASKLLREIEDAFGVPLFERHARGVVPTAYGDIAIRHAHSVLTELRRAQEAIDALQRGERLRVSIGTVMNPGTDLVPLAITLLAQQHPKMVVSVEIDNSSPMVAKLLAGQLDIVVGRILDADKAVHLHFEALAEERHSLIARAGHPLLRQRRLRMENLVDQAWVVPPAQSLLRERINAMFLQRGLLLPARIVETSSVPIITSLLRSSDMLVALPEAVVRPYCDAGMLCVLPIDLNVRMDAFGIITRRDHPLSGATDSAMRALRDAALRVYGRRSPG